MTLEGKSQWQGSQRLGSDSELSMRELRSYGRRWIVVHKASKMFTKSRKLGSVEVMRYQN
jgi:hypothetical protein